ncbi:MAG: hypothetical protein H0U74_18045 [Bradymonadaceae bacterium]|nr:hypothetical protein [Lujinxingiaceae bacterium]
MVLALVAGLMGMGVYMMGLLTNTKLKDEAMRMTSVIKYTYSQAAINNAQYRLVFDLDANEYYSEVTDSPIVVESLDVNDSQGLLPEEAQELANSYRAKNDLFNAAEADPFGVNRRVTFQRVSDGVVEPRKLPEGIRIYKVHTPHQRLPFESGKAAISFFRNGFQEQAVIVIGDEAGARYTLITEPLTGRVRIYSDELDAPPDFGEEERDD